MLFTKSTPFTKSARLTLSVIGFAAISSQVDAANCGTGLPWNVTEPLVERLVYNTTAVLSDFPRGGPQLSDFVAISVASNTRTGLPAALKLAKGATSVQKSAIGLGLRAVAGKCVSLYKQEATSIQEAIRKSYDQDLMKGYAATDKVRSTDADNNTSNSFNTGLGGPPRPSAPAFGSGQDTGKTTGAVSRKELVTNPFAPMSSPGMSNPLAPIGPIR